MSSPREATSVATKTLMRPAVNSAKADCLSGCENGPVFMSFGASVNSYLTHKQWPQRWTHWG